MLALFVDFHTVLTRDFEIYLNLFDEPISLTADSAFKDAPDMIKKNSCLRERYGPNTLGHLAPNPSLHHGFFTKPVHFHVVHYLVPVFSQSKLDCFNDLLMPMSYHLQHPVVDTLAFAQKKDVVFWRGSTTGGEYLISDEWIQYPRAKLLEASKKYAQSQLQKAKAIVDASATDDSNTTAPESIITTLPSPNLLKVDAAVTKIIQCDSELCKFLKSRYGSTSQPTIAQTLSNKYLLVLDGNSWSSALNPSLASNSIVLFNGIFYDWMGRYLKPWVHFIPFAIDSSDLESKAEWIEHNAEVVEEIGRRAREEMTKREGMKKCYTCLLLLEYERLYVNGLNDE